MIFGARFGRGACRCGSASDAGPLRAQPVQPGSPPRGGDPALGPAFGPLSAPLDAWSRFALGPVEVIYTTDAAAHPDHALTGARAAPPAAVPAPCDVAGVDLGRMADAVHPAHVQATALMAAHSLQAFARLGFRVPPTLTIRLCTFGGEAAANFRGGTEVWLDHVWVSTRLDGADALLTVAHEVFHRVQYLYNPTTARGSPLYAALREGGARLAEDWVLDSGDRYLKDGIEFLGDPGRPLLNHAVPGSEIAPHSYAAALFWRWLCEQHGEIPRASGFGHEVMRTILERMTDASGYILQDLREARGLVVGEGHLDSFQHLDIANGETLSTETDWGNFLVANWLHGTGRPVPDLRFDYVEDDAMDGAFSRKRPFVWPGETVRAEALADRPFRFQIPAGATRAGFAARYTVVDLAGAPPPLLRIGFEVLEGMSDPLVQLVLIRRDGAQDRLHDLIRSDGRSWTRFVPTAGLAQVAIIVAAREKPGRYRLAIDAAAGRAVLHAAPCNAADGTSYETDPRAGGWSWTSPDVALLDDGRIRIRVANRGDAASGPVRIALDAQGTTPDVPLRAATWRPVGEATVPEIAPGASAEVLIPWTAPRLPAAATGWGLRATIGADADRLVVLSSIGAMTRPERFDAVL